MLTGLRSMCPRKTSRVPTPTQPTANLLGDVGRSLVAPPSIGDFSSFRHSCRTPVYRRIAAYGLPAATSKCSSYLCTNNWQTRQRLRKLLKSFIVVDFNALIFFQNTHQAVNLVPGIIAEFATELHQKCVYYDAT